MVEKSLIRFVRNFLNACQQKFEYVEDKDCNSISVQD